MKAIYAMAMMAVWGTASVPAQTGPTIRANGTVNSADYSRAFAPGALVTIFGSGFGSGTAGAPGFPLPVRLGSVEVEVKDGAGRTVMAPLYLVTPGQINLQLPYDVTGQVGMKVRTAAGESGTDTITVEGRAPRVFTVDQSGSGRAVVTFVDGGYASRERPLKPGDVVTAWVSGLGAVEPAIAAGMGANAGEAGSPLNRVTEVVGVTVRDRRARVDYAGLAPYYAGLYQVNFQVPYYTVVGDLPVTVEAGGATSQAELSVPAEPNGFYWVIGAGKLAAGQVLNTATGAMSSIAFRHADQGLFGTEGFQKWTKNTQRAYGPVAGIAVTLRSVGRTVFDNNGIEDGTTQGYYDNRGGGVDEDKAGLWEYASMSNNINGIFAGYVKLGQRTTFDEVIGYFDGNGDSRLPFDPANAFAMYRMNVWSNAGGQPADVGGFSGDMFSSDRQRGSFTISDTGMKRQFRDGVTDPIMRVSYKLESAMTLEAGEYWFSHDVAGPGPATATAGEGKGSRRDAAGVRVVPESMMKATP